jgi:hypothetical protein
MMVPGPNIRKRRGKRRRNLPLEGIIDMEPEQARLKKKSTDGGMLKDQEQPEQEFYRRPSEIVQKE